MQAINYTKFDLIKDEVIERIKTLRTYYETIVPKVSHIKQLSLGFRYMSDENIFRKFCENLIERFLDKPIKEEEALEDYGLMDQQEIDQRIFDAFADAAGADYYYKFEKDY